MKCPHCKDIDLAMTHRQDVEIDYCPVCRGVWLDRGELDKLIERSADPVRGNAESVANRPPPPPPRYRDDDDDDDRYKYDRKKRRGGFLSEIFDFD